MHKARKTRTQPADETDEWKLQHCIECDHGHTYNVQDQSSGEGIRDGVCEVVHVKSFSHTWVDLVSEVARTAPSASIVTKT